MNPRVGILAIISVLVFGLFVWTAVAPYSVAQEKVTKQKWNVVEIGTPQKGHYFLVSKPVGFNDFTPRESMKWAVDFVVDPKRASDRQIMHVYSAKKVSPEFVKELRDLLKTGLKVALVFDAETISQAKKQHYIGMPVSLPAGFSKFLLAEASAGKGMKVLAAASEASLGAYGVDMSKWVVDEPYIALSKKLPGLEPEKTRFVTTKSAWPPADPDN